MRDQSLSAFFRSLRAISAFASIVAFAFILTAFSTKAVAQPNRLMLADIVIALRSKKVTLPERNKIVAEAVVVRGVTFTLTPEIEKELTDTGADRTLIEAIRHTSQMVKAASIVTTPVEMKPKPELVMVAPPPPDFSFYERRADASFAKGEFDAAIGDYSKAVEMDPKSPEALMGRGLAYANKKFYDLAIADYDKAIELKPKNAAALANRGWAFEQKGNTELAIADYDKAVEFEPTNEFVKAGADRLHAEKERVIKEQMAKTEAVKKIELAAAPPTPTQPTPVVPEFVELGSLGKTSAVRMVTPVYPLFALKSRIGGRIVVNLELDAEGNVTSAKASSGHPLLKQAGEEAALKSKFKPAMVGDKAVKAKAYLVYNFTPEP